MARLPIISRSARGMAASMEGSCRPGRPLAGKTGIRVIGKLGAAGALVLLERKAREPTNGARQPLLAASSDAHIEMVRRRWASANPDVLLMPPAQIGPNLQAGAIDLALLPERAAQTLVDRDIARIAARMSEPGHTTAFALRDAWIAAHPLAALALRDALAATARAS
jgi:hypothetical protein